MGNIYKSREANCLYGVEWWFYEKYALTGGTSLGFFCILFVLIAEGCVGFTCVLAMSVFDLFQVHYMLKCSCIKFAGSHQAVLASAYWSSCSCNRQEICGCCSTSARCCTGFVLLVGSFHPMGLERVAELSSRYLYGGFLEPCLQPTLKVACPSTGLVAGSCSCPHKWGTSRLERREV